MARSRLRPASAERRRRRAPRSMRAAPRPPRGEPASACGCHTDRAPNPSSRGWRTAHDQVVQLVVDLVDAAAQIVECGSAGGHGKLCTNRKAIEIVRLIAESKENIDIPA